MKPKISFFGFGLLLLALLMIIGWQLKSTSRKGGEKRMPNLKGKKVLMVIAPKDFRDEELLKPKEILEKAGAQVVVASQGVAEAKGMLGARVSVDLDLSKARVKDYQALIFVGGRGSARYFTQPIALNLAREAVFENKVVGAICIAPTILANAGVLKNKKATAFPSEKEKLVSQGALYVDQLVVEDGRIITANGPAAAAAFGEKIRQKLLL